MGSENLAKSPVVVVLDVETTGLKEHDKIVQIACLKIAANGEACAWTRFVNPLMDEQQQREAYQIHKISPALLATKPSFDKISNSLLDFLQDVDVIACHNALFDWSMLWNEFRRIDVSRANKFSESFQWLDILRLALLCFPYENSYSLKALKQSFDINPGSEMNDMVVDSGEDVWRKLDHDAMYDVFSTYGILKRCKGIIGIDELIKKYPKALLDTSLFIDMQKLRDEKRTTDEDLRPFALRAKTYYSTMWPKGRVIGDLTKNYLSKMTMNHRGDYRTDRRVVMIYEAALLDPISETQTEENPPKKGDNLDKVENSDGRIEVNPNIEQKSSGISNKQQCADKKPNHENSKLHKKLQDPQIDKQPLESEENKEGTYSEESSTTTEDSKNEEKLIAKAQSDDFTDSGIFVEKDTDSQHQEDKVGVEDTEGEFSSSPKKMKIE